MVDTLLIKLTLSDGGVLDVRDQGHMDPASVLLGLKIYEHALFQRLTGKGQQAGAFATSVDARLNQRR